MAIRLETSRLILRPLAASDLDDLVRVLNNLNVSRTTARIPFPYGQSDAEDFLALTLRPQAGTLRLSITVKVEGGTVCGGITYEPGENAEAAEIGYWLAEPQWGKGYGSEAARAMTDHAFEVAGYRRIIARYRLGNEASRRILEGLGFVTTGHGTCASRAEGTESPAALLELTRAAWIDAKGRR